MKVLFFTNTASNDVLELVDELQSCYKIKVDLASDPRKLSHVRRGDYSLLISDRSSHIFTRCFLDLFETAINTHPGMLPSHKGSHPLFWSVILNDILGVTIHVIDEQIDTGTVLFRRIVEYSKHETFRSVYRRCRETTRLMLMHYFFCKQNNTSFSSDPYFASNIYAFSSKFWHKKNEVDFLIKKLPLSWDTVIFDAQEILKYDIQNYVNSAIASISSHY